MTSRRTFVAALAAVARARAAGSRLFFDDFTGRRLDTALWGTGTWQLGGRTILSGAPSIKNSIASLPFKTWHQTAGMMTGCEIFSKQAFPIGNGLEFSARVRIPNLPKGLVTSLFGYTASGAFSDEVDIEFLTRQIAEMPGVLPMLLSTYNDFDNAHPDYSNGPHHWSSSFLIQGQQASDFHTYTIRLQAGVASWYFDDVYQTSWMTAAPDAPMPVRLNFWAPDASWTDAYDATLARAANSRSAKTFYYEVDWVEVRQL